MRTKSKIIFALILCFVIQNATATGYETKYINASRINIRAEPNANAKVIDKWRINQPVALLNKANNDWCQIANQNQSIRGYAQCIYLSDKALTTSQIELDVANLALALNRFNLTKQPEDEFSLLEQLFQQLERHFYISPSLHTYQLYQQTILYVLNTYINDKDKFSAELNQLIKAKAAQIIVMREALSFDPKTTAYAPVTRPITTTLKTTLEKRQGLQPFGVTKSSYFKNGQWVIGWEGGRFFSNKLSKAGDGVVYKIGFDGYNVAVLAGVVEMAKQHKVAINTIFRSSKGADGLSQMQANANAEFEFATVTSILPAYAITDKGLVKGEFKKASFAGDACWGEEGNTYAEFTFPTRINGNVHGVFISSTAINTGDAKVTIAKKTTHGGDTLTHAITALVDLDNDGIADLRTVISTDAEVARANSSPFLAGLLPKLKAKFMPVAGWYANDIYSLEANQDGLWKTLSIYNIVTCT